VSFRPPGWWKSAKLTFASFGVVTDYGLDDRMIGIRIPVEAGNFSLRHHLQTSSGAYPASYPMGTGVFSLGVKRPGREADQSPPSSAEVKECMELYRHSPNTP